MEVWSLFFFELISKHFCQIRLLNLLALVEKGIKKLTQRTSIHCQIHRWNIHVQMEVVHEIYNFLLYHVIV